MDENETQETEQVETSTLPRKILIVSAAVAGMIVTGGFLHLRNRTTADVDDETVDSSPENANPDK